MQTHRKPQIVLYSGVNLPGELPTHGLGCHHQAPHGWYHGGKNPKIHLNYFKNITKYTAALDLIRVSLEFKSNIFWA
jgi:hypothetical protein